MKLTNQSLSHFYSSHSNRGMDLENLINETNEYYIGKKKALIYKKPTPIGISKVSYHSGKKIIDKAYFKEKSTLDYNGIYKGHYIDFEAKESYNETSFPLSNIHDHQTKHIEDVIYHGGITFLIIKICNTVYYLDGKDYLQFIKTETRKSIPKSFLESNGYKIEISYLPSLDYLKIIDFLYFKENKNEEIKEN